LHGNGQAFRFVYMLVPGTGNSRFHEKATSGAEGITTHLNLECSQRFINSQSLIQL